MRVFPVPAVVVLLLLSACPSARAAQPVTAPMEPVWQSRLAAFDEATYAAQVEKMIAAFEQASGKRLVPGPKRKAGLKIYAEIGRASCRERV